jgi:hypothetical protein
VEIEIAGRRGMTAPKPVSASPGDSPAAGDAGAAAPAAAGH